MKTEFPYKRLIIPLFFGLVFFFVLPSIWKPETKVNAEVIAEESNQFAVEEEAREKISNSEAYQSGFKGIADRFLSNTSYWPIFIPIILVILVIFISFVLVELLIRKEKRKN